MERELNPTLLKNEKASCITPDVLADSVNKNIRFRPFHGPKKEISEPLVTKRIYVVNDTIDVITEEEEGREYNSIDKPGYQVALEESNHKGICFMFIFIEKLQRKINLIRFQFRIYQIKTNYKHKLPVIGNTIDANSKNRTNCWSFVFARWPNL